MNPAFYVLYARSIGSPAKLVSCYRPGELACDWLRVAETTISLLERAGGVFISPFAGSCGMKPFSSSDRHRYCSSLM